ncbi:MAG: DMT family transporter [Hyphomicrobiaceae bacterium]|nr:DMT family transporter [Hyphomicrobiaceae bacterium]
MDESAKVERTEQRQEQKSLVITAVLLMLLAGLMSSLLHVGVRIVSPEVPTIEIVLLRSLFTILITFPFLFRGGRISWRSSRLDLQAVRGVVGVCSMTAWYYALAVLPLGDAGALSFSSAIFVTLGAGVLFGESVGVRRWTAVVVGLIGTAIVLRPGSGLLSWGAVAALGSSILWAVSLLMAKRLAKYDSTLTITFYQPLMIAPFALIGSLPVWVWPSLESWLVLLGMGLLAAIGNYGYVHALRIADASISMPADYVRLLWMVGWGYLLFAEIPAISTWVGAALIMGSTLFITWRESRLARLR